MAKTGEKFLLEKHGKVLMVKINNPQKKNAMDTAMYAELPNILSKAIEDDSISVVVLAGVGDFFSSGNDITGSFARNQNETDDLEVMFKRGRVTLGNMIRALINFPKLLVAVVNGPVIGIAATILPLCDVTYCSETAYFLTPFTKLGLSPEGCSSYTFAKILGNSKATEMLLLNHKMSAKEALQFNFVSEIYKPDEFESKIWPKIVSYSNLMPETFRRCKAVVRKFDKEILEQVAEVELDALDESWHGNDLYTAAMEFMSRKSKL